MSDAVIAPVLRTGDEQKPSKAAFWSGWVLSVLPALFFVMGGVMDILKLPFVMEELGKIGFPPGAVAPLGWTILIAAILYLIPRTAVLGAIILTGYLGGAVAVHVRLGDPLLSTMLVPVYFGVVLWTGLVLRSIKVRRAVFG